MSGDAGSLNLQWYARDTGIHTKIVAIVQEDFLQALDDLAWSVSRLLPASAWQLQTWVAYEAIRNLLQGSR